MKTLRVALAQINSTVGDFQGNKKKILQYLQKADDLDAQVIAFPELCITGYPPEDLLLKPQFIDDNLTILEEISRQITDMVAIVGYVDRKDDIYNAAAVIYNRQIIDVYHKILLPNYGVFDEYRYFQTGTTIPVFEIGGATVGVGICEDIWYPGGPFYEQALTGAEIIININASPYDLNKTRFRETMLSTRASDNSVIVAYVNCVGGQDELVFDGSSMVVDQEGNIIRQGKQFEEDLMVIDLNISDVIMSRMRNPRRREEVKRANSKQANMRLSDRRIKRVPVHDMERERKQLPEEKPFIRIKKEEEVYKALVLGTADYVNKNRFNKVIVGLSGGIDSSMVTAIAVDALGHENVKAIFMPSQFTSLESREDVYELVSNLNIEIFEIAITQILTAYINELAPFFIGRDSDETEENVQARIRGNLLMAFSNKFGYLVLTTGNKSEMSVGYATLYGDMAGGFAVIKDVPKTLLYEVAKWRNHKEDKPHIPERVITKEPTAELRENQKDTDSLPPYHILDPILHAYVEKDMSFEEIVSQGCDNKCADRVISLIDKSEYKRRQSPPGIKITGRAFGKDRRFPITNRFSIRNSNNRIK